jgi:hypothetical protein
MVTTDKQRVADVPVTSCYQIKIAHHPFPWLELLLHNPRLKGAQHIIQAGGYEVLCDVDANTCKIGGQLQRVLQVSTSDFGMLEHAA